MQGRYVSWAVSVLGLMTASSTLSAPSPARSYAARLSSPMISGPTSIRPLVPGGRLNLETAIGIAQKNGCPFAPSANLKPIDFVVGQFAITDGKIKGWAAPQLYILDVNRSGQ